MLAANKILEMRVEAEHVEHLLSYCLKTLQKRKGRLVQSARTMPTTRNDDEASEVDDACRKRRYDLLGEILQVDVDQNGRPATLLVPGYEPPDPKSESAGKDALCALAEMFRGKAGAMANRWDAAAAEVDVDNVSS